MSDTMHGVLIGALDVTGRIEAPEGYTITAQADDASWGNPRAVTRALEDLMRQGARIALDGWDNREAFLRVKIKAQTGEALAAGEAALFAELGKRNTLTWTPPGGFAAPTVFDIEWSEMDHDFDSDEETLLGQREYAIRLVCRPFARSVDRWTSGVMSAPASSAAPVTVVDDGSSTAGWAASQDGTVSTTGTSVRGSWLSSSSREAPVRHFARNPDFAMTGTQYLRVEWSATARADHEWRDLVLTVNGVSRPASSAAYIERVGGKQIWWFLMGTGTITQVGVRGQLVSTTMTPGGGGIVVHGGWVDVHDISRANQIVASGGTGHQVAKTVNVPGSAPTTASIHVWDNADTDLGDVVIYTGPRDGMISLDPFLTTSKSAFGGTVSGTSKPFSPYIVYDIPSDVFDPTRSTGYVLLGRLNSAGLSYFDVTVRSIVGQYEDLAIPLGPVQEKRVYPNTELEFVDLGAYTVPPMRVDGPDAGLRVTLYPTGVTGTPIVDDLWLIDIERGALTWIDRTDAGAPVGHVRIEPASVDQPYPRVMVGSGPNGVVGWEAPVRSYGEHSLTPGESFVRVIATASAAANVQLESDVRWHTHARTL